MYLHKVLNKEDEHWAKKTLYILRDYNIGWAKQILELTEKWGISYNWDEIKQKTYIQWKDEVGRAAEKMNIERLKEECETKNRRDTKQKTKTKFVVTKLSNSEYVRKPDDFISRNHSILHTRALIMGRYGMLKCANNFSYGHGTKDCNSCKVIDDETHRINNCKIWDKINLYNKTEKISFDDIYSDDYDKCITVVKAILSMWDFDNGKNEMKQ